MRRFVLLAIVMMATLCGHAKDEVRHYHDILSLPGDSIHIFPSDTDIPVLSQAIEARVSGAHQLLLAWDVVDQQNYRYALVGINAPADNDLLGLPHLLVEIGRCVDGYDEVENQLSYKNETIRNDSGISLAVEIDRAKGVATILAGSNELNPIAEAYAKADQTCGRFGVMADGAVNIETVVTEAVIDPFASLHALYNIDEVASHGLWTYLDRDNNPAYTRLGGMYTLGLVPTQGGRFDIVYVDGAQIAAVNWQPGMLKGRLTPTTFADHYNLLWYDSTGHPVADESSATFSLEGNVLTFNFPLLKTAIRFAKQPVR